MSELYLDVHKGEILGLIGPNGAGKTTVFNMIAGSISPTKGNVEFKGEDITGLPPHRIARKGIARTFQLCTLFEDMTVLQNILLGFHLRAGAGFWRALIDKGFQPDHTEGDLSEKAMAILDFMSLEDLKDEFAKNLPHGYRKRLCVSIALAANPELLLLDEPAAGMNPKEVEDMMTLISKIRERGITVLLIEHNMRTVMGMCDRIAVLNFGRKIAEGSPKEIQENEEVIKAYLGVADVA